MRLSVSKKIPILDGLFFCRGGGGGCPPLCNAKLCKIVQLQKFKKRQSNARHPPPVISTTVTLLHNWLLFICCIWFLITVTIIKLSNIVVIKLI